MGSCAITSCLSSSPIPLHSEASLPCPRVTLTDFALSSYENALPFPISFPVSNLARLGVKLRLSRFWWRAFASTYPLVLSHTSVCMMSLSFLGPALLRYGAIFSTPCSRSNPYPSHQDAALTHFDSLSPLNLVLGQMALPRIASPL